MAEEIKKKYTIQVVYPEDIDSVLSESDKEMDIRAAAAVKAAIDKAKVCKKPIARYDSVAKKAYMEYPDGRIEYAK